MSLAHDAQKIQTLSPAQHSERPLIQDGGDATMLDGFPPHSHASVSPTALPSIGAAAAANINEDENSSHNGCARLYGWDAANKPADPFADKSLSIPYGHHVPLSQPTSAAVTVQLQVEASASEAPVADWDNGTRWHSQLVGHNQSAPLRVSH